MTGRVAVGPSTPARTRESSKPWLDSSIAAAAIVSLAAAWLFGTVAAAAFIALALVLVARTPAESARTLLRLSPLFLIPLMGMVSTIWSDAPQRTLRASIQLLLTMVATVLICRKLGARRVILTLFVSFLGVALTALPYVPSGAPLKGLFASKNQLGSCLHLLFALGLAVLCDRGQSRWTRIVALCALPFCLALLPLTQSATAMTLVGVTLALFPILTLFGRVPMTGRIVLALLALVLMGVALMLLPQINEAIADFRQNVLKKDATLTGRSYLWDYAARLSAERPLLGHGYYAFWRPGNLDAEALWRWGGIAQRTGFNFHNAFVEMKVDLGYVGQALLIATCGAFALSGLRRQLTAPSIATAFFITLQVSLYLGSYSESVLVTPFGLPTVLWIASGVYAISGDLGGGRTRVTARGARAPRPMRWRDPLATAARPRSGVGQTTGR